MRNDLNQPTAQPPPADNLEARWRHLTEAIIFAVPYGTTEYLAILDATGRPYNREQAISRARALAEAINEDYAHLPIRLLRCHAANDDPTFRLRYGHLLPKRPPPIERYGGPRRPGPTPEEREAEAEETIDAVMGGR